MKVDVVTQIVIACPVDVVSAYAADPSNAPAWYVNIDSVDWKTPPPAQIGSQVEFVARFLGRTLRYTYEFAELVPGERVVMRTQQGPFPMETTYTWESAPNDETLMTLRNCGEPAGFSRLMAPIMKPAMRRANRKDVTKLKTILESQAG
ncbi:MAG: SRPBCC family protein [Acidimicrobiia bacterium]